jgi:hypothetical protein
MKAVALLGGLALGCSFSFSLPPSGEGGYCNNAWDGVPCKAGLVCNTYDICQQPVPAGGECIGDVCEPDLVCVVDQAPSTTGSGVCLSSQTSRRTPQASRSHGAQAPR